MTAALTDQLEQPALAVLVVGVRFEVIRQLLNALGEQRDLYLSRTGIAFVLREIGNDRALFIFAEWHMSLTYPGYDTECAG